MRAKAAAFLLFTLPALPAFGQTSTPQITEKVFYFTHGETAGDLTNIANTMKTVADIRDIRVEESRQALTVLGTAGQLAIAGWIAGQLGEPAPSGPAPAFQVREDGEEVRVFRLARASTPQQLQEMASLLRSTGDIQRLFVYAGGKAVVVRAIPAKLALAEWFIGKLDSPPEPQATHEFPLPVTSDEVARAFGLPTPANPRGRDDNIARVFFLSNVATPRDLQEVVTLLRSICDIQRLFAYHAEKAIALRANAGQAALAAWLVEKLDRPSGETASAPYEYRTPREGEQVVRVFYLTRTATDEDRFQIATQIRTSAYVQRLFVYNAPKALVLRGTVGQVLTAERLIRERGAQ